MTDPPFPLAEQGRRFGFSWDSCIGFGPHMDFWSFYEKLVAVAPPGSTIVEIGCYHGRSLICLGLFAREADKGLQIIGVDKNDMGANDFCKDNLRKSGLRSVQFLEMASEQAASIAKDESCFAVFIDGGHLHDIVNTDIHAWMPKVQPGGWLTGHDYAMYTVQQPVSALFGERVIVDERWQDVWIVPKCEPYPGVDIHANYPYPPVYKEWEP